ncbi:hypothetical protein AB0D83_19945 [Streptomyces decoyicus]
MADLPHTRRRQSSGGEQRAGQRVSESVTSPCPRRQLLGGAGTGSCR